MWPTKITGLATIIALVASCSGGRSVGGGAGASGTGGSGPTCGGTCDPAAPAPVDAGLGPCTYRIPAPEISRQIDVFTDTGALVPQDVDHTNGWDYTDAAQTSVTIYGPFCDQLDAGTVHTICMVCVLLKP